MAAAAAGEAGAGRAGAGPGVAERYFTRWYQPDVKGNPCEDHCILQHSNSCIRGRLIEVNESILSNPSLLQQKPFTDGYIAVVLPKFEESKSITRGLLTRKEYEEVLSKRFNSAS